MVFHQKLLEKSLFNCKMTGPAMVLPASPDFWKAPLVVCKHWVLNWFERWPIHYRLNSVQIFSNQKLSECGGLTSNADYYNLTYFEIESTW